MKIECVVVCQNYSDFLEVTLPETIQNVDRVVVITHPDDQATKALCSKYSVDCVETTVMHEDEDLFNKGRCINVGLGHMAGVKGKASDEWILHLDADILLPHSFRSMLSRSKLDPKNIYGADRVNIYGADHFAEHKDKLVPHYSSRYFVQPPKEFPLGARIIHYEHGYTPIGYFQLWAKSANKKYPIHQGNAEHTDVLFSIQWPRVNRILLPEIIVGHLESNDGPIAMGANWGGRKTPPFRPRKKQHCHCHHHPKHPYCPHHHHPHKEK